MYDVYSMCSELLSRLFGKSNIAELRALCRYELYKTQLTVITFCMLLYIFAFVLDSELSDKCIELTMIFLFTKII